MGVSQGGKNSHLIQINVFIFVFLALSVSTLTGVSWADSIKFLACIIFIVIPIGYTLLCIILGKNKSEDVLESILFSCPLGVIAVGGVALLCSLFKISYLIFIPLVIVCFFYTLPKIKQENIYIRQPSLLFWLLVWMIASTAVFVLATNYFHKVDDHHIVQAYISNSMLNNSWPVSNVSVAKTPLYYNYIYHAFVGVFSEIFDVSSVVTVSRLSIVFFVPLLVFTFVYILFKNIKSQFLVLLTITQIFLVPGFASPFFYYFAHSIPVSLTRTMSSFFGVYLFLVLSSLLLEYAKDKKQQLNLVRCFVWLSILILASGTRSTILPVLGAAAGVLWLYSLIRNEGAQLNLFILGFICALAFLLSLIAFYGVGQEITAINSMDFGVLGKSVDFLHSKELVGSYLAFIIMILGRFTCLLPGIFFIRFIEVDLKVVFYSATYVIGVLFVFFCSHVGGYSEYSFFHYGHFAFSVVLAVALDKYFSRENIIGKSRYLVKLFIVALLATHVVTLVSNVKWSRLGYIDKPIHELELRMNIFIKNKEYFSNSVVFLIAKNEELLFAEVGALLRDISFYGSIHEIRKYKKKTHNKSFFNNMIQIKRKYQRKKQMNDYININEISQDYKDLGIKESTVLVIETNNMNEELLFQYRNDEHFVAEDESFIILKI